MLLSITIFVNKNTVHDVNHFNVESVRHHKMTIQIMKRFNQFNIKI